MRLKHAMGLVAALLPAACAPGLDGFDSYAAPSAAYATPYRVTEPSYRSVAPPPPPFYGVPPGIGPGYYGYDRDRGRRDWERQREREAQAAYQRQEFERRRFEQARREDAFRRDQFRREQIQREHFQREQFRREEARRDEMRRTEMRPPAPPPIAGPPPSRALTPEQQSRVREDVQRMFGVR